MTTPRPDSAPPSTCAAASSPRSPPGPRDQLRREPPNAGTRTAPVTRSMQTPVNVSASEQKVVNRRQNHHHSSTVASVYIARSPHPPRPPPAASASSPPPPPPPRRRRGPLRSEVLGVSSYFRFSSFMKLKLIQLDNQRHKLTRGLLKGPPLRIRPRDEGMM